ncbi:MAG: tRNA 2-thiocytidine biosynthesis TtcA family protein [Defluviitaleaceae bacterium]|nr:tRNA 2-thiocytidine biosynthesis TtcA family protein [Defluviitaleaceae bacterium]MCL2274582.1 tRNA 2-thiocytidine biosynthesis TtcA family protein [Defluviitaleaceae bacterium]
MNAIEIERSLTKKFRPVLWRPFIEAIKQYHLIQPNDVIGVCISGGKDSMLLAKLMQALQRFSDFPFTMHFIVMDPGYSGRSLHKIHANAELLGIPIQTFSTNIFDVVTKTDRSPCYLCARMRRGHLYKEAQRLGCNKIALGHHFSDVVETILMNVLYNGVFETMMPKLRSKNYTGMALIRPLYCVHEDAITAWVRHNELSFIKCGCPLAENCTLTEAGGRRASTKALLKALKRDNPDIEDRIFQSTHRVNLETIIGYKKGGISHSFLDAF